jgi:hypothetical protein
MKTNFDQNKQPVLHEQIRSQQNELENTIHILTEVHLRNFVVEYAATKPKFRKDLPVRYSNLDTNTNAAKYEAIASNAFDLAAGRHGHIDYHNTSMAFDPIDELLLKAEDFIKKGIFSEASYNSATMYKCHGNNRRFGLRM